LAKPGRLKTYYKWANLTWPQILE